MSEERKTPTPAPRTRSGGGRNSQQPSGGLLPPASPVEVSTLRRSSRSRSDAAPVSAEPVGSKSSRKAATTSSSGTTGATSSGSTTGTVTSQGNVGSDAPPGEKLNAHGGVEEDWGTQRAREPVTTFGIRVAECLHGYKEARNSLYRLQEEVSEVKALMDTASKRQKAELSAKMEKLIVDIKMLQERRTFILENSGPFKETLINDDHFVQMEREKERRLRGLQPERWMEEEADATKHIVKPPSSGGLHKYLQTPYSGLPAGQAALSSRCSSGGSGDEGNTSGQGGALMAQIQLLESPGRLQDLTFGDELPREAPGGKKKRKSKNTKPQEQVQLVYTPFPVPPVPAARSARCVNPISQPGLSSVVDSVQESGESMEYNMAVSSISVCSNNMDGADEVSAEKPDSDVGRSVSSSERGGSALGNRIGGSGATVHPLTGGGGGLVPESDAGAPVALSAGTAVPLEQRRRREGSTGAKVSSPPRRETRLKPLFCIGAADPIDQRRPDGAGDNADEAEGTNKIRVGASSRLSRQATRSLKGPVEVTPTLVPRDAEAKCTPKKSSRKEKPSSCGVFAGPVSVNVGEVGGAGCMTGDVIGGDVTRGRNVTGGGGDVTGNDVTGGGGNITGGGGNVTRNATGGGGDVSGNEGNVEDVMEVCTAQDSGVGVGTGPVAPPAVTALRRSYARVTAGGSGMPSSSSGSGDGVLQRRLLEALKKGERSITVEGREVDLSFWIERHGRSAFQEQRVGETAWSLPTSGPGGFRRNVVRLRWQGSDTCPSRAKVVELLLKMGFKAGDIYALIHPYGTPEFDVSFVRPEGLELFWSNHELAKNKPVWRDFAVQALSRQNEVKRVTVLTRNESLSCVDIMTWLGRYGEVINIPQKNRDEFGIWSGAWTFVVKLRRSGNTVTHIPSAAFLGRDRIQIFYQGQPKLCHRCGDPTHFSANCKVQKCALCGGIGHLAASCAEIRCHLCGDLGHPFSRCPRSFANAVLAPAGEGREAESAGEGTSRGGGTEGPVINGKKKTPAQLRRLDKRQRDREMESRATGKTPDPVPAANRVAEALRDDKLDEEVRRIRNEEGAISSESSHCDSGDEEGRRWPEKHTKRGTKKKRGDLRSSPTLVQVPKEGKTDSPLVGLSNRFQTLDDISSSSSEGEAEGEVLKVAVGPTGDAESSSPGEVMSSGEGTGPESGDEDGNSDRAGDMDTSVSLKRVKSSSDVEGGKGSGKKKAV